jgi:chaperonin GroEL
MGGEEASMVATVTEGNRDLGFNATIVGYDDLVKWGVLDPTKVAYSALQNPARAAGLVLTSDASVHNVPEKDAPPAVPVTKPVVQASISIGRASFRASSTP